MIRTLTVINYLGEQLTINLSNPFNVGMAITEITGLGPVSANIITTDNASMDGAVYNSSRLSYRNIVITMKLLGTNMNGQSIEATRHDVYKYFPIKKPLWLIFEGDKRNAMIQGYVESNEPEIFSNWETTQISIICPNPYFESLAGSVTNMSGIAPTFEFPFITNVDEDVFEMGRRYLAEDIDIYYTGEVETGIDINLTFDGHTNPITIYNVGTNDKIIVDTNKIESRFGTLTNGDKILITTRKGDKKAILIKQKGEFIKTGLKEMEGPIVTFDSASSDLYIKSLKVDFELTQDGTGDPSPTNVRDITGVSGLYIFKARKNLLQRQRTSFPYTHNGITYTLGDDETVIANGTATGGYSYCSFNWNLPTKADTILTGCPAGGSSSTYELQITGGNGGTIREYGEGRAIPQGTTGTLYCIVREGQTVKDLVFKPMMRLATDSDPTFVPFDGVRYYKDLGDTYYKGTYDFISGKLTLTHKLLNLTFSGVSATSGGSSTSNEKCFYSPVITGILKPANEEVPDMYCNRAKVISRYANYRNTEGVAIHQSEGRIYTYLTAISSMTLAEAQAWLADNPIQIVYPLETPEVIQLTGTSIKTLEGLNNIWSRNGGDVDIEVEDGNYMKKEFNIINCLDKNFTWFELHKGDNIFSYTVENGSEGGLDNLQMTITNKILYEGL